MRRKPVSRMVVWMGALALVLAMVPGAVGQCGLSTKPIKPMAWHLQYGGARPMLLRTAFDDNDQDEPSIVGMWHVVFTAHSMNGQSIPDTVIDNSLVVWHSDKTEIMNSSRPAQDGNFCLGIWERTGKRTYYLNHIPWQGNDPSNAPSGIGNPEGAVQLTEQVTLSPDGSHYSGSFTLTAYDPSGNQTVTFSGTFAGTRVTISTKATDLL